MHRLMMLPLPLLVGIASLLAAQDVFGSAELAAGDYSVQLSASEGSHKGAVTEGTITLVGARPTDRSPRTGEKVKDTRNRGPQFYGWIGADLKAVGAPLCSGGPHPSPHSRDPVYPGVVVVQVPYGANGPYTGEREIPAILVATLTNLRNGSMWTDGCGFAMYLLTSDGECHTGQWSEWGLRADGRGTFRLCRK
jgi:hypothetical protein